MDALIKPTGSLTNRIVFQLPDSNRLAIDNEALVTLRLRSESTRVLAQDADNSVLWLQLWAKEKCFNSSHLPWYTATYTLKFVSRLL